MGRRGDAEKRRRGEGDGETERLTDDILASPRLSAFGAFSAPLSFPLKSRPVSVNTSLGCGAQCRPFTQAGAAPGRFISPSSSSAR